jgi:hypothetical protein
MTPDSQFTKLEPFLKHVNDFAAKIPEQARAFEILSLLKPFDIVGKEKVRIGEDADGGYVLINDFSNSNTVYSLGIGNNIGFDWNMACRGHDIYMFDHTIEKVPLEHPKFHFHKIGISGVSNDEAHVLSLNDLISYLGHEDKENIILKMDIEGAEWDAIGAASADTLGKFQQITMEIHLLNKVGWDDFFVSAREFFKKINEQFTLCHVHSNNVGRIHLIGGFPVPEALELSYVKTSMIERTPSRTLYPTPLDRPNNWLNFDHFLWFFPFFPEAADPAFIQQQMVDTMERSRGMNTGVLAKAAEEVLHLMLPG